MKIHNVVQNTPEWLRLRAGVITASEFDNIVTSDFTPRESKTMATYMNQKLAERWTHAALSTFTGFGGDMEQGSLRERDAIPWLDRELNVDQNLKLDVQRVGFVTTDDGRIGCSPDVAMFDGATIIGGGEIKCPKIETHIGYLLAGTLPLAYRPQVHGAMLITGAPWWYFLSYHPTMPKLLLKIERDENIQKALHESLTGFLDRFDMAYARLLLRGEPPVDPERAWKNAAAMIDQPVALWRNSQ